MSSKNGTKIGTDNLVGDLGGDVAETRETLGDTAETFAEKVDDKRVDGKRQAVEQVGGSVRRHPAWWVSVGAGVAAAAAGLTALRWRQARRTPRGRAARAWRGLTDSLGG